MLKRKLLCRTYSRYPVAITRGAGSRLWDVDGKEYVDPLAGIAVEGLGHCNPELCGSAGNPGAQALEYQQSFLSGRTALIWPKILLVHLPSRQGFFCNSGAEANEACIKLRQRRYMRKIKKSTPMKS